MISIIFLQVNRAIRPKQSNNRNTSSLNSCTNNVGKKHGRVNRSQDQGRVAPLSSIPPHMQSWPLSNEVNPKRYRGRGSEAWEASPSERRDQVKEAGLNWKRSFKIVASGTFRNQRRQMNILGVHAVLTPECICRRRRSGNMEYLRSMRLQNKAK